MFVNKSVLLEGEGRKRMTESGEEDTNKKNEDQELNVSKKVESETEFETRMIRYSVDEVMSQMRQVIRLAFVQVEDCGFVDLGELVDEPPPVPIDSWASGAIPVRQKKPSNINEMVDAQGKSRKLPSIASRSRAKMSVVSKLTRSKPDTAESKKRKKTPSYIVELPKEEPTNVTPTVTPAVVEDKRKQLLQQIKNNEALTDESESDRVHEDEKLAQKAAALKKDLADKEYILDHDGKLVIVQHVNPEKLPNMQIDVDHSIRDSNNQLAQSHANSHREKKKSPQHRTEEDTTPKGSPTNNEHYRCVVSFSQSVLKNPQLDVRPGVSFMHGSNSLSGPAMENIPNRMSRTDFSNRLRSLKYGEDDGSVPRLEDGPFDGVKDNGLDISAAVAELDEMDDIKRLNMDLIQNPSWGQNREEKAFVPPVLPASKSRGFPSGSSPTRSFASGGKLSGSTSPHAMAKDTNEEAKPRRTKKTNKIHIQNDRAKRILGLPTMG